MKNRNQNTAVTTADIAVQRAAIEANLRALEQQEQTIRAQEQARVTAALNSFPDTLGAIVGRKLSVEDAFGMLRSHIKGKLSLGEKSPRAYRTPLSEQEKARLKAVLSARQAVVDAGGTPDKSISQISREFKTTDATVNKYKAEWGLTRARSAA